jgi:hypothetical protein
VLVKNFVFANSAAIVIHSQDNGSILELQIDSDPARATVAGDVGKSFLKNPKQGG